MNGHVFNACMLIGWTMFLVGACMVNLAAGLLLAGLLLIGLVLFMARIAGVEIPTGKG